jgi:triacylglycerol lipase
MRPSALLALGLVVVALAAVGVALTRHTADASNDAGPPVAANLRCATPAHPNPVVLVPGTFEATSWTSIADGLTAQGYCVKAFQYPEAGTGPIAQSASDLARFVDGVLRSTHATRVSIVAHSEGGVVARYYVRFSGGAAKVANLVALAPPNHGTTTPLVIPGVLLGCVACAQQTAGSSLLAKLNAGNGVPGPVDYTVIETRYDAVVTPYQSALLHGPSNRVTNVVLQDACPDDLAGHLTITDDPVAVQWVEEALASRGPANRAFKPRC